MSIPDTIHNSCVSHTTHVEVRQNYHAPKCIRMLNAKQNPPSKVKNLKCADSLQHRIRYQKPFTKTAIHNWVRFRISPEITMKQSGNGCGILPEIFQRTENQRQSIQHIAHANPIVGSQRVMALNNSRFTIMLTCRIMAWVCVCVWYVDCVFNVSKVCAAKGGW